MVIISIKIESNRSLNCVHIFFYYVFIHSDRSAWRCCDDSIRVNTQCKNTHAQLNVLICWLQTTKLKRKRKMNLMNANSMKNCTLFSSYALLCFTLIIFSLLTRCVLCSQETTQVYAWPKWASHNECWDWIFIVTVLIECNELYVLGSIVTGKSTYRMSLL